MSEITEKICNKCNEVKALGLFNTAKNSKDGFRHSCKACLRKQDKERKTFLVNGGVDLKDQGLKKCVECKTIKPTTEFHKYKKTAFRSKCKPCRALEAKAPVSTFKLLQASLKEVEMKLCHTCLIPHNMSDFHLSTESNDGHINECRYCANEYSVKVWESIKGDPIKLKAKYETSKKYRRSDKGKETYAKWYRENSERSYEVSKVWRSNNKDKRRKSLNKSKNKTRSAPKGRLDVRMGNLIRSSLVRGSKNNIHWEILVGYTVRQLKEHLEKQFTEGMTWEIFCDGKGTIHIDHIKPKSLFNYNTPNDQEFKECWALSNLQPLWALDNLKKSAKY